MKGAPDVVEGEVITWIASGGAMVSAGGETIEDASIVADNSIDNTAPLLLSATVPADGNFINLVFDEPVSSPGAPRPVLYILERDHHQAHTRTGETYPQVSRYAPD